MLRTRPDRRWRVLAGLVLAVALAHAVLLASVEPASPRLGIGPAAAMQVRALPGEVAAPAPAPTPHAVVEAPRPRVAAPRPAPRPAAPAESVAAPTALAPAEPVAAPVEPLAAQAEIVDTGQTATFVAAGFADGVATAADGAPPPTYRTTLPAAATLHYDVRRGALSGSGELRWAPSGEGYALTLEGSILGLTVLTQVSRGGLDAARPRAGALHRQRVRRARAGGEFPAPRAGKITFSGPSVELPWHAGAQDRLSWMVQLAAIVAADPRGASRATLGDAGGRRARRRRACGSSAASGSTPIELAGERSTASTSCASRAGRTTPGVGGVARPGAPAPAGARHDPQRRGRRRAFELHLRARRGRALTPPRGKRTCRPMA